MDEMGRVVVVRGVVVCSCHLIVSVARVGFGECEWGGGSVGMRSSRRGGE